MTRCWTAKTFQDCAANAKQEGGGVEEGGELHNHKYLRSQSQEIN